MGLVFEVVVLSNKLVALIHTLTIAHYAIMTGSTPIDRSYYVSFSVSLLSQFFHSCENWGLIG